MDQILQQPLLFFTVLGIGAVTFVNGWTDAPGAIVSCVSSGAMSLRRAAVMSAFCNLVGIGVSIAVRPAVTATVLETVRLPEGEGGLSLAVLLMAVFATVIWAVGAWYCGLPTSESHGLLAGLSGAASAYSGFACVSLAVWLRVVLGLFLSLLGGVFLGFAVYGCFNKRKRGGRSSEAPERYEKAALAAGASAMSAMHGAQDGQKMIGLWLLAATLGGGNAVDSYAWAFPCALLMGGGTLLGGGRIVHTLGSSLTKTGYREGIAADLGAALCLLLLTWFGIPVSTTHTKTAALIGAGMAGGRGRVDKGTVIRLVMAWLLTFPACFLLAYGGMRLLLR